MKMYTLLRDNLNYGSFTYEEMVSMKLKQLDLLWIEGESVIWKYPSELQEFKKLVKAAPLTEGTVVNARKEKQIAYFKWKKEGAMADTLQDAYQADIPIGYEYLLAGTGVTGFETDHIDELSQTTFETIKIEEEYDYTVLGESQMIDVKEAVADSTFLESTVTRSMTYKSIRKPAAEKAEHVEKKASKKKRKRSIKLPAILVIITSAFMHLKF